MPKIIVKQGETIESALKRFKRVSSEIKRQAKKHEYHLRPGLKKRVKSQEARKRDNILRKKSYASY